MFPDDTKPWSDICQQCRCVDGGGNYDPVPYLQLVSEGVQAPLRVVAHISKHKLETLSYATPNPDT